MYGDCMKWCPVCDKYYEDLSPRSYSRAPECPVCPKKSTNAQTPRTSRCNWHGGSGPKSDECPDCVEFERWRDEKIREERRNPPERPPYSEEQDRQWWRW